MPEGDYERFVKRVLASGELWGLRQGTDNWAYCASNEYEDTDVLVFWSSKADAQKHAQGDWSKHVAVPISLEDFLDRWLPGMDEDDALVGPDWGSSLDGVEVEPSELAEQLTEDTAE